MRKRHHERGGSEFEVVSEDIRGQFTVGGKSRSSSRWVTRASTPFGAWLAGAGFLALGIGGGVIAWLRQGQGGGAEQVVSALAIAAIGVLAAVVHARNVIILKRAEETEREIEHEHIATRAALDRAAAVPPLGQAIPSEVGGRARGSNHRRDEPLDWQIEQIAESIEADAALIRDLKRIHGPRKLAEAWQRSCPSSTSRAVAELADLPPSRRA